MGIAAAVGYCQEEEDAFLAGAKAARMALEKTNGRADAVFVFSAVKYDQQKMLEGVNSVTKNALLVGCSTDGEIVTDGYREDSVCLMVLNSDELSFSIGYGLEANKDARTTGQMAAQMALDNRPDEKKPSICFLFGDGVKANGAELVRGAQAVLGNEFHIVGGLAGDGFKFEQTYQYYDNQAITNGAVSLLISGDVKAVTGVEHGWTFVGRGRKVTKAEGNVVYELDGESVFKIYEDYLGERAEELPGVAFEFPFGVIDENNRQYLRCPVGVDREAGTVTFVGEVPVGSTVKMTSGTTVEAIKAARDASEYILSKSISPAAIFVFDCCARKKVFGRRTQKEIDAIQGILGEKVPLVGFYTYGEIAPGKEGGSTSGGGSTSKFLITKKEVAKLYPDDVLLFFTDGIVEAIDENCQEFGEARLLEIVKHNFHLGAKGLIEVIERERKFFCGKQPQFDDLTLMVVKMEG